MTGGAPEADHILILWTPGDRVREEEREVREVFGPLTKKAAEDLGATLHRVAGAFYEVFPMTPSPLQLTNAGHRQMGQT